MSRLSTTIAVILGVLLLAIGGTLVFAISASGSNSPLIVGYILMGAGVLAIALPVVAGLRRSGTRRQDADERGGRHRARP